MIRILVMNCHSGFACEIVATVSVAAQQTRQLIADLAHMHWFAYLPAKCVHLRTDVSLGNSRKKPELSQHIQLTVVPDLQQQQHLIATLAAFGVPHEISCSSSGFSLEAKSVSSSSSS